MLLMAELKFMEKKTDDRLWGLTKLSLLISSWRDTPTINQTMVWALATIKISLLLRWHR